MVRFWKIQSDLHNFVLTGIPAGTPAGIPASYRLRTGGPNPLPNDVFGFQVVLRVIDLIFMNKFHSLRFWKNSLLSSRFGNWKSVWFWEKPVRSIHFITIRYTGRYTGQHTGCLPTSYRFGRKGTWAWSWDIEPIWKWIRVSKDHNLSDSSR